jgi:type I restriction enzyme S subunit
MLVGVAQQHFNIGAARRLRARFPDVKTQIRIGSIVKSYCDLIEVNQRRIAILEEMARRLFEEWFVHFHYPGHEAVPLVDTPLGRAPQMWRTLSAAEVIEFDPKTKVAKDGLKIFVPMGSLSTTSMVVMDWEMRLGNSGAKFRNGDTLMARITPCLENGKTGFVDFLNGEAGFGSTEFTVMRGRTVPPTFVYLLARSEEFRATAIKSMGGADGRQRVRVAALEGFELAVPPPGLLDTFQVAVGPIFKQVRVLANQNTRLRAARDLLLPKLMSGEIEVGAAEDAFAEAAE